MTDQEFNDCRDALLMAAKMICDQPLHSFYDAVRDRIRVGNIWDATLWKLESIICASLWLKREVDKWDERITKTSTQPHQP